MPTDSTPSLEAAFIAAANAKAAAEWARYEGAATIDTPACAFGRSGVVCDMQEIDGVHRHVSACRPGHAPGLGCHPFTLAEAPVNPCEPAPMSVTSPPVC